MTWWILALVLVGAGCDTVLGLELRSPDAPMIDAPIDAAPDNCPTVANMDQLDTDGDGRGDVCDACSLLAEVVDHDEDRDGIGDRCDNCPHIASVDQRNSDGDHLGDLCDAAPAIDCIVLFDPFVTLPAAQRTIGVWDVVADELHQRDVQENQAIFSLATPVTVQPTTTIGARVVMLHPNSVVQRQVGVWGAVGTGGISLGTPSGLLAELLNSTTLPAILYVTLINQAGTVTAQFNQFASPSTQLSVGTEVRIAVSLATSPLSFFARADVGPSVATLANQLPEPPPAGLIALRTVYVAAAFTYVLLTDRPGVTSCPPR